MDARTTEVLIAGAGPTGLALACELQRLGVPTLVVDRQLEGANTSRAAVIHARTLEVLESLSVTDRLLARGIQVPVFSVRDRSQVLASVSFRELPTKYPFTLMCPQDQTEAILRQRLAELAGEVQRPFEVVRLEEADGSVQVTLRAKDAQLSTVYAKWVIGCDGAHSTVREQARIGFEGGSYEETFVLADVEMSWSLSREEVFLFFSPAGLMVVAPLPSNRFRIVATVDHADTEPTIEDIQSIVDQRGPEGKDARVEQCAWSSRFRIQHRVAHQLWKGRVLLAGDAAHVHSPAGGQGMNTGIQDAISMANALAAVLQSDDTAPLAAWESERLKVARGVVLMTDRMTRAATLTSPLAVKVRNALISLFGHTSFASQAIAARLAELDN